MSMFSFILTMFCLFHWIEKWRSRVRSLGHLESSGTKIVTKTPIVCQLYVRMGEGVRGGTKLREILEDEFQGLWVNAM